MERISIKRYGHFWEHLGRYSHGGAFADGNSAIPNVNGICVDKPAYPVAAITPYA